MSPSSATIEASQSVIQLKDAFYGTGYPALAVQFIFMKWGIGIDPFAFGIEHFVQLKTGISADPLRKALQQSL